MHNPRPTISRGTDPAVVRQHQIDWIERAYARGVRRNECGIPHGAIAVGVWLAFRGWDGPACNAERLTGWGPDKYRLYAESLTDVAMLAELDEAERILFTGANPLVPVVAQLDEQLVELAA